MTPPAPPLTTRTELTSHSIHFLLFTMVQTRSTEDQLKHTELIAEALDKRGNLEVDIALAQETQTLQCLCSQPESPASVQAAHKRFLDYPPMSSMDKFIALTKLKEEAREEADKYDRLKKKAWSTYFKYRDELNLIEKKLQGKKDESDEELERNCKRLKKEILDKE